MKFVIINGWNVATITNYAFSDLKKKENVTIKYLYFSEHKIKFRLFRALYNFVCDKRWISKEKRVAKTIENIILESTQDTVVLITNEVLMYLKSEHIKKLQQNNITVVLILIDPISANYITAKAAKDILEKVNFDLVLTFDPDDAEKYGFKYCNTLYSKVVDSIPTKIKYDLCYVGNIKDRFEKIKQLLNNSEKNNAHFFLNLAGCSEIEKKNLPSEAILKKIMNYEDVLKLTQESNCIFDMTQEGQKGVTFRYYEAIVYNKKLLTNNYAVTEMPYYNERYIKLYNNIDDIDWEWVKKIEKIDYGYKGDFSPLNLLKRIERILNEKEIH